jgi:IMP dehydrogenase
MMKDTVCFDDVLLLPQYSDIETRDDVDLSVEIPKVGVLKVPIISSPMDTVTGTDMAIEISRLGGLGIVHRYNSPHKQFEMAKEIVASGAICGAAVGVTDDYVARAGALVSYGVKVICIDVAHGHHVRVKKALLQLRQVLGSKVHIMAGNVATRVAVEDLADWGADSVRIGIGGGSICSTRIQTGHGVPTLESVLECATADCSALLIADGGIRNSGDIVKALAAGADCVMLGSMLAGTMETPGPIIEDGNGNELKAYRGMASVEAQYAWRGRANSIEGVATTIPIKGPVADVFASIVTGVRSGLSYTGARSIKHLQARARFIGQSSNGVVESSTHVHRL